MSLEQTLASIPGLGGYLAGQQMNQQREAQQLQSAQGVLSLQDMLRKRKDDAEIEGVMASSATPEEAIAKLSKLGTHGVGAATKIAQLQEHQGKAAMSNLVANSSAAQMQDPDFLDKLALKDPRYETLANKAREKLAAAAQMKAMQGTPTTIQPDPQEVAQAADQGTPAVAPVTTRKGGIFDDLSNSTIPHVAQAAKNMQAQLDRSGATIPPAYWQKQHETLAARESAYLQQKALADIKRGDAEKPIIPPEHAGKTGDEFLKTLPIADQNLVKKIAAYEINPASLSTRGGHRERALALAAQYNPEYDQTQYANKNRAIQQFGSGSQGNTVRSLNVAIEHIDTLQRAADALKNGDFTPGNKAYNEIAKVFGVTPPNTFEGIRDIVANEVVKGTIGNAGALQDRAEAAAKVKAASSPQQLKELMNGWTELMGGQVKGLRQQYEGATGLKDFDTRYLRPRTLDAIRVAETKAGTTVPKAVPPVNAKGWKLMTDAGGNKAYVSPDGKSFEEAK